MNLFSIMNIKEINRYIVTSAVKGNNWKWPSYQILSSTRLTPLNLTPMTSPGLVIMYHIKEDNCQTL